MRCERLLTLATVECILVVLLVLVLVQCVTLQAVSSVELPFTKSTVQKFESRVCSLMSSQVVQLVVRLGALVTRENILMDIAVVHFGSFVKMSWQILIKLGWRNA